MNSIFIPKPETTSPGSFASSAGIGASASSPASPPFEEALADASRQASSSPTAGESPASVSPETKTASPTPANGAPLLILAPETMNMAANAGPPTPPPFANPLADDGCQTSSSSTAGNSPAPFSPETSPTPANGASIILAPETMRMGANASPPTSPSLANRPDTGRQTSSSSTAGNSPVSISRERSPTPANGAPLLILAPGMMLSSETPTIPVNLSCVPSDSQTPSLPSTSSEEHDSTGGEKPSAQDQALVPTLAPALIALALLAAQNPPPVLPPAPSLPASKTSTPSPDPSTESVTLPSESPGQPPPISGAELPAGKNIPSPETIFPSSSPSTPRALPPLLRTPAPASKPTSAKNSLIQPTPSPFPTVLPADLSTSGSTPAPILAQTTTQDQFGMLRAVNSHVTHSLPTLPMTGSKSMDFLVPETSFLTSAFQTGDSGPAASGGKEVLAAASPEQLPETIRSFLQTAIPSLPRRVEIHLATPEGARVTLFIARSNGELRAQLSTSDPTVLQWLQQQVQSLRQTQWGSTVNWLPPQQDEEKPAGQNPRDTENRRHAPRRDETTFATWSPTDVAEPTLITRR